MANGRVVLSGTLREVKRRFGRDTVSVAFDGDGGWLDPLAEAGAVRVLNRTEGLVTVRLGEATAPREVLQAALGGGVEIDRFEVHEPPLSDIFRQAVQGAGEQRRASAGAPAPVADAVDA
jgi:ABC-2 type transport system ATP-binding protein